MAITGCVWLCQGAQRIKYANIVIIRELWCAVESLPWSLNWWFSGLSLRRAIPLPNHPLLLLHMLQAESLKHVYNTQACGKALLCTHIHIQTATKEISSDGSFANESVRTNASLTWTNRLDSPFQFVSFVSFVLRDSQLHPLVAESHWLHESLFVHWPCLAVKTRGLRSHESQPGNTILSILS